MIDKRKLSRGRQAVPLKVLIQGAEGVGKTTFAAGAPRPRFIDLDRGSYEQDIERVEAGTFEEVLEWIEDAVSDDAVETLVIDSLSRLEGFITTCVCGENDTGGLVAFGGGYGRGDSATLIYWRQFLKALDRVAKAKHVILIGHTGIKGFADPLGPAFNRFALSLREGAANEVKRWVNYVLFARTDLSTRTQETTKKSLGISSGDRWIYTDGNPAYDAKHRGSLPAQLPLSWAAFYAAVLQDRSDVPAEIESLAARLVDADVAAKVRSAAQASMRDPDGLLKVLIRTRERIEEQSGAVAEAERAEAATRLAAERTAVEENKRVARARSLYAEIQTLAPGVVSEESRSKALLTASENSGDVVMLETVRNRLRVLVAEQGDAVAASGRAAAAETERAAREKHLEAAATLHGEIAALAAGITDAEQRTKELFKAKIADRDLGVLEGVRNRVRQIIQEQGSNPS